jgi:MFS family permease
MRMSQGCLRVGGRTLHNLWLSFKVALMPPLIVSPERIRPLQLFMVDGILGNAGDHIALTFVPLFALALGASYTQLGWLAATASMAGALALWSAAFWATRYIRRRQQVIALTIGISRFSYLVIALVPWLFAPSWRWSALTMLWAIRTFLANWIHPTWTAFSIDLVPNHIRDFYLHARKDAMTVAAVLALPIAGLIIRTGEYNVGYPAGLLLAFALGLAGLVVFMQIPHIPETGPIPSVHNGLRGGWRSRSFLTFCGVSFLWNASLQLASPFLNVYLIAELRTTALGVGLLAAIGLFFGFAASHLVADVVRYRGALWTIRFTGLLIPFLPWAWMFVSAAWQVALLNMLSGILWAAYNLAAFRLLIALTPETARSQAIRWYQIIVFVGACVGPPIGGFLADRMGFRPVFLLSGAGRLLAALLLWMLVHEPERHSSVSVFVPHLGR